MKKLVSLMLALALCMGLAAPAMAAEFSDVPASHTFHDAISYCAENGIVGGYEDGTFKPSNTVTQGQFCIMLSRAFYAGDVAKYSQSESFSKLGRFMPNYIALYYKALLDGTSFGTNDDISNTDTMSKGISRYDMAQLMANILTANGKTVSNAEKSAAQGKIGDWASIPETYRDAVSSCYALGVLGGMADGTFSGSKTMNRGQAAIVIYRLAQYVPAQAESPAPVETPVELEPEIPTQTETPETPPPSAGTLTNGKAITEANVTAILNQLRAQYPTKTDTGMYTAGNASPVKVVTLQYTFNKGGTCSTTSGCGGWAARVFDAIFGQNATLRKTTLANARPGDVLIKLNDSGKATHVAIVVEKITASHPYVVNYGMTWAIGGVMTTDANVGAGVNCVAWDATRAPDGNYDIWTAYPN